MKTLFFEIDWLANNKGFFPEIQARLSEENGVYTFKTVSSHTFPIIHKEMKSKEWMERYIEKVFAKAFNVKIFWEKQYFQMNRQKQNNFII